MSASPGAIRVEVACGTRTRQAMVTLTLAAGATVAQAVTASGLPGRYAELGLASADLSYAVWGRAADAGTVLRDGDRVEILPPLMVDPREARRRRAAARGRR